MPLALQVFRVEWLGFHLTHKLHFRQGIRKRTAQFAYSGNDQQLSRLDRANQPTKELQSFSLILRRTRATAKLEHEFPLEGLVSLSGGSVEGQAQFSPCGMDEPPILAGGVCNHPQHGNLGGC